MSETKTHDQFDDMNINELRKYASHLRVALNKTDDTDAIREKIRESARKKKTVRIAAPQETVEPGWAKIILNEDPMPGASNLPVYVNSNGYECTVPKGVEVIVPLKIVNTLNDAVVWKTKQVEQGPGMPPKTQKYRVLSYPFQVLEMVPGPDPRPSAHQMQKERVMGPRIKFRDKFGYWPRRGQLMKAVSDGFINLDDHEEISKFEEDYAERRGE